MIPRIDLFAAEAVGAGSISPDAPTNDVTRKYATNLGFTPSLDQKFTA